MKHTRKVGGAGILALASALAVEGCRIGERNAELGYRNRFSQTRLEEVVAQKKERSGDRESQKTLEAAYHTELPEAVAVAHRALREARVSRGESGTGYDHEMRAGKSTVRVLGEYWADDDVAEFDLVTTVRTPEHTFSFSFGADRYGAFSGSSVPQALQFDVEMRSNDFATPRMEIPLIRAGGVFEYDATFNPKQHTVARTYGYQDLMNGVRRMNRVIDRRDVEASRNHFPFPYVADEGRELRAFCFDNRHWFEEGSDAITGASFSDSERGWMCEREYALKPSETPLVGLMEKMANMREEARKMYWGR